MAVNIILPWGFSGGGFPYIKLKEAIRHCVNRGTECRCRPDDAE